MIFPDTHSSCKHIFVLKDRCVKSARYVALRWRLPWCWRLSCLMLQFRWLKGSNSLHSCMNCFALEIVILDAGAFEFLQSLSFLKFHMDQRVATKRLWCDSCNCFIAVKINSEIPSTLRVSCSTKFQRHIASHSSFALSQSTTFKLKLKK